MNKKRPNRSVRTAMRQLQAIVALQTVQNIESYRRKLYMRYEQFITTYYLVSVCLFIVGWLSIAGICNLLPSLYQYKAIVILWSVFLLCLLYRFIKHKQRSREYENEIANLHQKVLQQYELL